MSILQPKTGHQINKSVLLPLRDDTLVDEGGLTPQEVKRSIHINCTADAFNLKKLAGVLKLRWPQCVVHSILESVHCRIHHDDSLSEYPEDIIDIFFFEVCSDRRNCLVSGIFKVAGML